MGKKCSLNEKKNLSFIHIHIFPIKNLPTNAVDPSLIPGSGRLPGVGNGNPL